MIDLKISDTTNDLILTDGDLTLIMDSDQIRQAVKQALQTFLGEWFLNTTQGIPYYQTVFTQNPNLDIVQATLTNAILSVPGIVQLTSFDFTFDNGLRKLNITFEAKSTNGQTINLETTVGV